MESAGGQCGAWTGARGQGQGRRGDSVAPRAEFQRLCLETDSGGLFICEFLEEFFFFLSFSFSHEAQDESTPLISPWACWQSCLFLLFPFHFSCATDDSCSRLGPWLHGAQCPDSDKCNSRSRGAGRPGSARGTCQPCGPPTQPPSRGAPWLASCHGSGTSLRDSCQDGIKLGRNAVQGRGMGRACSPFLWGEDPA